MLSRKVTFRILRFKPGQIDPARFQDYELIVHEDMSVLECLEKIRLEQDKTLMYRHSCRHSACGTCACQLNGKEKLACITNVHALKSDLITLTPLDGFKPLGDLVVDMKRFYEDFSEHWTHLRKADNLGSARLPGGMRQFSRFENCIECGACVSACPVTRRNQKFLGPAVLAAVHNELEKSPQKSKELLLLMAEERGARLCERALNCSRVCPTGVYPARHIADLRRLLEKKNI